MYHVLLNHYDFAGVYLMSNHLKKVDNNATLTNMRWAISHWLPDVCHSDSDDVVFIFFTNHGGGYNTIENGLRQGRWENPIADEGKEIQLSNGTWVGIDECLLFPETSESYWDDDLKGDLNSLALNGNYGTLILTVFACFSGGLIDDLTAQNRIIMTSANETYTSKRWSYDGRWLDEWPKRFTDALHWEEANYSTTTGEIVHYYPPRPVNADIDPHDGYVSMWEAWKYAWDNDPYRVNGTESPWLDDNGNGYPTYKKWDNETVARDHGAPYDDGTFARSVHFRPMGGGGCPSLFVWNDLDYAEDGVLNIHARSDIILEYAMTQSPNGLLYRLQLRELDSFTSHIDHVRLYAVDENGQWHLCPLTFANHSDFGPVTLRVMFNDDQRVDLKPSETLNMHFFPSISNPAGFMFEVSGYNSKQP
jgi:hypothetical protein